MSKLLVVIDYQNDFVVGSLGFEGAKNLDNKIYDAVRWYYLRGEYIIFTKDTHDDNYFKTRESKIVPILHCKKGTAGNDVYGITGIEYDKIKDSDNVFTIEKKSFAIDPEDIVSLRSKLTEVRDIVICGLVTNICVISNVIMFQSAFPEAKIIVESKVCDSNDKYEHYKALDIMKKLGVEVIE